MAQKDELRGFIGVGENTDDAPEYVGKDHISAKNMRFTGTAGQELGYGTNIESNELLSGGLLAGFNQGIGGGAFEDVGLAMCFRYNSGKSQILIYNNLTQTYTVVYEDKTNSAGATLLPLTPDMWVMCILINKTYAIWWSKDLEVGYTNLNTLMSGGYGTILPEDLSLLKPQCMVPPTGVYGSDPGKPANFLFGKLPQFIVQYVNDDFNQSAWSTRSKRIAPYQQNTPILGSDVHQNNYIIVSVFAGSIRATTINIACQFNDSGVFSTIKTVTRAYITALPHTAVDVPNEVYEAYDPGTNIYSFAFYNNTVAIPVATTETDLLYDNIWPSNAGENINGNIVAIGAFKTLYPRPVVPVTVTAVGYNPNIAIPAGTYPNPLRPAGSFVGASGSGAGGHKRIMSVTLGGSPATNDTITIITADVRNSSATTPFIYTVPSGQSGNLAAVVGSVSAILGTSNYVLNGDGTYTITFIGAPFYGLQTFGVELFFAGANVANSIPTVPDNTTFTMAIAHFDAKDRPFPIATDNTFIVNTPSKAQVNGNAVEIVLTINQNTAPAGAVSFQILITKPPINKIVETTATTLTYKGVWNAATNSPALAVGAGGIGDTYQITTPATPAVPSTYHNIGNGAEYPTGAYVTNVGGTAAGAGAGLSYAVVPKSFGDLTNSGSIMAFSLNPLNLFNSQYSDQGVTTVLGYDFVPNDRCTLHYVIVPAGAINGFTITAGTGYTNGTYPNVVLTGGTGTGATANVTVSGGVVSAVVLVSAGTGYLVSDVLTGAVTGGTGWSIGVSSLYPTGINYFNMPCIDLAVLGCDAGTYVVKLEKSSALTYANNHIYYNGLQIDGFNVFMRLYSPAPIITTQDATAWYEIGERATITNGLYDKTSFTINDGGAYFKTRQFADAPLPYTNPPVQVLATDLNYSDFYASPYWSKGRVRTYYDVKEQSEQKASIITSQSYISGSRLNGLTRFYPQNIYGEGDGQCSSSKGRIEILWQRGGQLVIIQGQGVMYAPVNEAYTVLNAQLTGTSISEKLLNNGRYATENIGIGSAKESFWKRFNNGGFIAPYINEPVEIGQEGILTISGKNSKYFKGLISAATALRKRMMQYYDTYYEEVILCVQSQAGIIRLFPFGAQWNPNNSYTIAPGAFTSVNNGSHSTVVYDGTAGTATYTPAANYVGNDVASFSFNPGGGVIAVNNCLNWTSGNTTVNPFSFAPKTGVPLTTEILSNSILVTGNDVPVPISITGGQYSINGGAFTASAGTVNPNDSVVVEVLSSGSTNTATSCTLTISSTSATFTATTKLAGNFSVSANYGFTIEGLNNNTATGVPAGFATISVPPGSNMALPYTAVTAGSIMIIVSGLPAIPGHIRATAYVAGVSTGSVNLPMSGNYGLTIGNATDPTLVLIAIESF